MIMSLPETILFMTQTDGRRNRFFRNYMTNLSGQTIDSRQITTIGDCIWYFAVPIIHQ